MKEALSVVIPTEWKDITLKKWLELQKDLEDYKDDEEAQNQLLLWHLCGLDIDVVKRLPQNEYNSLLSKLNGFGNPEDLQLQTHITIEGKEYGFEPNLSNMSYGAYADVTQYESVGIDKNWTKVMDILYRPIIDKKGSNYSIEPYTGKIDDKKWLDVTMDVHFGAMFFFLHTSMDLYNATLKSLMEMEIPRDIKQILVKNGKHMQQSLNWQRETLKGLIR
jgi:hypothetical protein